ncbi:MAG TPA: YihY/virulence factor BrkB family protein [Pirellulales bacterium]
MRNLWPIVKQTFLEWQEDRVPRLGAALAYYSLFSLAPVLVIAVSFAASIYGEEAAQHRLADQLDTIVGTEMAQAIQQVTNNVNTSRSGNLAAWLSMAMVLIGATGAVVALKDALNTVWGVVDTANVWWVLVRDRLLSLAVVFSVGCLLLASVVLSAFLSGMSEAAERWLPVSFHLAVVVNWIVSLIVVTVLFAVVFIILPDVRIHLRDVWVGSMVTAVLFLMGRELIGFYLARVSLSSTFGAAGSLVAVMLWVYYSAQIFLLGAEFTQVYSARRGASIAPAPGAKIMSEEERRQLATSSKGKPRL